MKLAEGYGIVDLERAATRSAIGDDDRDDPRLRRVGGRASPDAAAPAGRRRRPRDRRGAANPRADARRHRSDRRPRDRHAGQRRRRVSPRSRASSARRLPNVAVVAFKSHLGHTLGGAGAVELILSAMALRDGVVPPCANDDEPEFRGLNLSRGVRGRRRFERR
jgi:hypothetical protein